METNKITENPTPAEMISWMQEQIKFKKIQHELQKLDTDIAVMRYQQITHMQKLARLTDPESKNNNDEIIIHELSQEDIDSMPENIRQHYKVGDKIPVSKD